MVTTRVNTETDKATKRSGSTRPAVREANKIKTTKVETAAPKRKAAKSEKAGQLRPDFDLHQAICAEAYFLAEQRGFAPGGELDDWLVAERVVIDRLRTKEPTVAM